MLTPTPSSVYACEPVQRLLAQELAAMAPILADIRGTASLFLRPDVQAPARPPPNLSGATMELALDGSRCLRGALVCAPDELPLAGESCKLVVAQHVFERVADPAACAREVARVLAPDGVALVFGFNPLSLWRPWLIGKSALHLRSARHWRDCLQRHGVEGLQTRYVGALSPWMRPAGEDDASRAALGRLRGSWLLVAHKRRSVLTPLRPRRAMRELARRPYLAPGGAQRQCARVLPPLETERA